MKRCRMQTLWLDFDGVERHYYTLQPGQRVRQATFTAHPVREQGSKLGQVASCKSPGA